MNRTLFLPAVLISTALVSLASGGWPVLPASEPTAQAAGLPPVRLLPTPDMSGEGQSSESGFRNVAHRVGTPAARRQVARKVGMVGSHDASGEAWHEGGIWHIEAVDSEGSVGRFTSLALDEGGYPHISYLDGTNGNLKYAYQDASGWHIETVDSEGYVGRDTSLALNGDGYPHISYNDSTNQDLKYAYKDASGWHIKTVDSEGGSSTSLTLDGSGYPHISYRGGYWDLKYAYQDASGWHIQTVDSEGAIGWYTSLALDGSGYPHISYSGGYNDLKYAYQDASGWHIQIVDSEGVVGLYTSLTLDKSAYPHISYPERNNVDLKYAYQDASGWHIQTVDSEGDVGEGTSLALDGAGHPHISYYDDTNDNLKYAYYSAGITVFLPLILKHYPHCDPYEPNNSPPGWGPLASGQSYQAKLCWGDNEDYYHFTITSFDSIVIHLDVPATVDYHMWLYHESDTAYPVGSSANIGKGVDEYIDYTPTVMGTYYIRIRPRLPEDHDDVNAYTLVASFR